MVLSYQVLYDPSNKLRMWNKTHSQSNVQTEDGEEEERELNVKLMLAEQTPIIDVWAHNFSQQLRIIASLAETYPIIALDTQFPGNLIKKHSLLANYSAEQIDYQLIWHNVESTKLIQIGLTLADSHGNMPTTATWQFHLQFDLKQENSVPESIHLLKVAGIDFHKLSEEGIQQRAFAQAVISSGLILNKAVRWIVFHGGYDFGYLLRLLRSQPLPKNAQDFYKSIKIYFPNIYDLRDILKDEEGLGGIGLSSLAEKVGCARVGPQHQAGSDSLLTIRSYFKLKKLLGQCHFQERANHIYGIIHQQQPQQYHSYNPYNYQFGPLYEYLQYSGSYQTQYLPYYPPQYPPNSWQ